MNDSYIALKVTKEERFYYVNVKISNNIFNLLQDNLTKEFVLYKYDEKDYNIIEQFFLKSYIYLYASNYGINNRFTADIVCFKIFFNKYELIQIKHTYKIKFDYQGEGFWGKAFGVGTVFFKTELPDYQMDIISLNFIDLSKNYLPINVSVKEDGRFDHIFFNQLIPSDWIIHSDLIDFKISVGEAELYEEVFSMDKKEQLNELQYYINLRMKEQREKKPLNDFYGEQPDSQKKSYSSDYFERILHLKYLLDKGAITQEEFEQKKAEWIKIL